MQWFKASVRKHGPSPPQLLLSLGDFLPGCCKVTAAPVASGPLRRQEGERAKGNSNVLSSQRLCHLLGKKRDIRGVEVFGYIGLVSHYNVS